MATKKTRTRTAAGGKKRRAKSASATRSARGSSTRRRTAPASRRVARSRRKPSMPEKVTIPSTPVEYEDLTEDFGREETPDKGKPKEIG